MPVGIMRPKRRSNRARRPSCSGRHDGFYLAADGQQVIVNHRDDAGRAEEVVSAIRAEGGDAVAARADVSKTADFAGLVEAAVAAYGRWDVLVNNAAIAATKPITDFTDEQFDAMVAVNVRGPFLGCRLAATRMEPGGAVINISSSTTALMLPGYAAYDCTKGAVEALTHVLAREFGPRQITANTVSPGATETESYRHGKSPQFLAALESMSVFGRLGRVDEIAAAVAFLAGPDARWITGQNLRVNGGTT
jgi:3-oxoacyl-[acyl-carrier protein] reductase